MISKVNFLFVFPGPGSAGSFTPGEDSTHFQRRDAVVRIRAATLYRAEAVSKDNVGEVVIVFSDDLVVFRITPAVVEHCSVPTERNVLMILKDAAAGWHVPGVGVQEGPSKVDDTQLQPVTEYVL
jgi:hypothetical protein